MIVIVMGVAGCGKTTIGRHLAQTAGWAFLDADDFHSPENVAKMRAGTPLTDADRADWLQRLRDEIVRHLRAQQDLVLACSALREAYRSILRRPDEPVRFVYLRGDQATIRRRLEARVGHYMSPVMLDSQFAALEEPRDALIVPVELAPDEAVSRIIPDLRSTTSHCSA